MGHVDLDQSSFLTDRHPILLLFVVMQACPEHVVMLSVDIWLCLVYLPLSTSLSAGISIAMISISTGLILSYLMLLLKLLRRASDEQRIVDFTHKLLCHFLL